jgi:hypothetical protein
LTFRCRGSGAAARRILRTHDDHVSRDTGLSALTPTVSVWSIYWLDGAPKVTTVPAASVWKGVSDQLAG